MKKMNIYEVIFKDGARITMPSQSKKQALERLQYNGEVIGIVDTTLLHQMPNYYLMLDVLTESHAFTDEQIDVIMKTLEQTLDLDFSYNVRRIDVRNAL